MVDSTNLSNFRSTKNTCIGKDIAFENHRHYSHFCRRICSLVCSHRQRREKLLRTSPDHWLDVSINSGTKVEAMPVTGYTATGAAPMWRIGDAQKPTITSTSSSNTKNVSPTTMYAEGNPVIEKEPLSFPRNLYSRHAAAEEKKSGIPGTPRMGRRRVSPTEKRRAPSCAKRKGGVTEFVSGEPQRTASCRPTSPSQRFSSMLCQRARFENRKTEALRNRDRR
jgi:hypothetical protein